MAKFGWDERRLFNVSEAAVENLSGTPSDADSGQMLIYIKSDHLYIKKPSVAEVIMPENASNLGAGTGVFAQKNATTGFLEFKSIVSADGRLDITTDATTITLTVDVSDINDDLDHGVLQGLADDDHLQYLLLAGRSGGQIANGGNAASNNLTLRSTSHATKGSVKIDDDSKFEFNSRVEEENEVSTTDATVTTISTIPLADDTVYWIRARIIGRQTSGGQNRTVSVLQGAFYRAAAGSATQQGNTFQEFRADSAGGFDSTLSVSGNNVLVQVQGLGATNVDWKVQTEIIAQN